MPDLVPTAPCPVCKRPSEEAFKPFCSRRCKDVDLHRWMAGVYAVPVKDDDEDEDGERVRAKRDDEGSPE